MNIIWLKKVLIWLKSYYYIPLVVVLIIISLFFFRKSSIAFNLLETAKNNYRNQIKVLEDLREKENNQKEQLQKQYENIITMLETKYTEEKKQLQKDEKKRVEELVKKYSQQELSRKLSEEFGLNYGENND